MSKNLMKSGKEEKKNRDRIMLQIGVFSDRVVGAERKREIDYPAALGGDLASEHGAVSAALQFG